MALSLEASPVPLQLDADGVARVGATRVTLDTVVAAFNEGATPEEIALSYDTLHLADIYAVIGYYLRHRFAGDGYLHQREQKADEIRRQNESRSDPRGIRERLLGRLPDAKA